MKSYNIFQALFLSFNSADLYRAVAHRWRGIGFWYLFFVVLLATLPPAARLWMATAQVTPESMRGVTAQIPRIEIRDGVAHVVAPQPVSIRDPESKQVLAVIDTNGDPSALDDLTHAVLLTRKTIIIKQPHQTRAFPLRDLQPFIGNPAVIDQQWVEDTILWWIGATNVAVVPVVALFSFIYRFIELLILGLIGLIMVSGYPRQLNYAQLLRISAMALTPAILINAAYDLIVPHHPFWFVWWVICVIIPISYLKFGIRAAYMEAPPEEQQDDPAARDFGDDMYYDRRQDEPY